VDVRYRPSWSTDEDPRSFARRQLVRQRREEFARGVTVSGPHRDDLDILAGAIPARTYGSRGQQRATVLSLRLAEREVVRQEVGEDPVMLFDDVLSDLDTERVRRLLTVMGSGSQVLLTATDRVDLNLPDANHIVVDAAATRARSAGDAPGFGLPDTEARS
jgi:DNA replication and repair protein RecF